MFFNVNRKEAKAAGLCSCESCFCSRSLRVLEGSGSNAGDLAREASYPADRALAMFPGEDAIERKLRRLAS